MMRFEAGIGASMTVEEVSIFDVSYVMCVRAEKFDCAAARSSEQASHDSQ